MVLYNFQAVKILPRIHAIGALLLGLGIGIILFEGLALNNRENYNACSAGLICDSLFPVPESYIGFIPALAGAIILRISKINDKATLTVT